MAVAITMVVVTVEVIIMAAMAAAAIQAAIIIAVTVGTIAVAITLVIMEAARSWLFGLNPHLGDRRPIDLVRAGRAEELLRAIRAERAESFA